MQRSLPLLFLLLTLLSTAMYAQRTEEDARDDLDYTRSSQRPQFDRRNNSFWFGTGAQLGFVGGNNTSFFNVGLTPIVGYKINNILSVGPRGGFAYNRYRQDGFGGSAGIKTGYFTWSLGAFTRAKVFRGFFAHAEYSLVNEVDGFTQNASGDIEPVRSTRAIPFLGAGLSQGGGPGTVGFEILILFRLTQPETINDSPYEFRTGINYNF